jgi:glutamate synthase (NADPH/NADH) small chain
MISDQPKKQIDLNRREMPKQDPIVRAQNFNEVALGYSQETANGEALRCLQCKKPGCVANCPVEIDIPAFIARITDGNFAEGLRILKNSNCLPAVSGRVCPQEDQCEKGCILHKKAAPVAIGRLERFLAD